MTKIVLLKTSAGDVRIELDDKAAPLSVAKPFETESLTKIIVLLTDGDNTQNRFSTNSSLIDDRSELACYNVSDK